MTQKASSTVTPALIYMSFKTYSEFALTCAIYRTKRSFPTNLLEFTLDKNVLTARPIPQNLLLHWIDDNYDKWARCLYMFYTRMEWCTPSGRGVVSWERHNMATHSALLVLCERNAPVAGRFSSNGFDYAEHWCFLCCKATQFVE